jgi:hypothetical protein
MGTDDIDMVGNYKICIGFSACICNQYRTIFRVKIPVNGLVCHIIFINHNARKVETITKHKISDASN